MADTIAPTILVSSISSGVGVIVFGIDTGLDYQTLIAGIAGGATALSYLTPDKILRRVYEVITASVLAGYTSPAVSDVAAHSVRKLTSYPIDPSTPPGLQLAVAFMIAFLAHGVLLPGLSKVFTALFGTLARRYKQ